MVNINLHEREGTSKSNWDAQIKRIEIEFNTKRGNDWNKYFHFIINRVPPALAVESNYMTHIYESNLRHLSYLKFYL